MVRKSLIVSYILLLLAFTAPLAYRLISRPLPEKTEEDPGPIALSAEAAELVTVLHEGEIVQMDKLCAYLALGLVGYHIVGEEVGAFHGVLVHL